VYRLEVEHVRMWMSTALEPPWAAAVNEELRHGKRGGLMRSSGR
jgi:hypothetical protein